LKFIYLELPKFKKTIDQLNDHFDKWLLGASQFGNKRLFEKVSIPRKKRQGVIK
jgi:hypothetical protein